MGCLKLQYESKLTLHRGGKTQVGNSLNLSRLPQKSRVETGYYYYGARYYNSYVSTWLSIDPIALYDPIDEVEHYLDGQHNGGYFNPRNTSVYGYTYQNPIIYVDPNGKQNIVTDFLIGAGVEYGTQVAGNLLQGFDLKQSFYGKVDFNDVGVAGVEGVLTAGLSSYKRIITIVVLAEVYKSSIDIKGDGSADVVGTEGSEKTALGVATESTLNTGIDASSRVVSKVAGKLLNSGLEKELNTATNTVRKTATGSAKNIAAKETQSVLKSTIEINQEILDFSTNKILSGATKETKTEIIDYVTQ